MKKINNIFYQEEKLFLAKVELDYVSLANIVHIVMGTNQYYPDEEDYLTALNFIEYLMDKYGKRLKYSIGPGDEITDKNPKELIAWLKEMWYAGKYYRDVDFGVWFELEEEN